MKNKKDILQIAESSTTWFYEKRLDRINRYLDLEKTKIRSEKKDLPTILSYFLKYAKDKQKRILSEIKNNEEKFFHGKINESYKRISRLKNVKSKSFKK